MLHRDVEVLEVRGTPTVADAVVQILVDLGVRHAFGVSGGGTDYDDRRLGMGFLR